MKLVLPLALVALAGCAATPAETARSAARAEAEADRLSRALAGYTAEPPVGCINQSTFRSQSSQAYGSTLVYEAGNLLYRNDMNGQCPELRRDDIRVNRTPTGQLCRGDIVQLLDRNTRFPVGSCSYGDFIPYRRTAN